MAENDQQEDTMGINGLSSLQDDPQPVQPTTENVTAEDLTPELKTENVTAKDPHSEADEDPEQHIGDEVPDPWEQDATGSWSPLDDDSVRAISIADEDITPAAEEQS